MQQSNRSITPLSIPVPAVRPAETSATIPVATEAKRTTVQRYMPWVFAAWSFGLSLVVLPYYVGGDQLNYRAFYETREGLSLSNSFADYTMMLGTQEPGYFLFVEVFSSWADKDIAVSVMNGLFGYALGRCLADINANLFIVSVLALNYYLMVLYLAAERLKLGLLFVLISALAKGVPRYAAFGAAVLSHVQTVLLILTRFSARALKGLMPILRGRLRTDLLWTPFAVIIVLLPLLAVQEHTEQKLDWYMSTATDVTSRFVKPLAFAAFTVIYAKGKRWDAAAMQLPIVLGAALVGGERLVIFGYFVFMYYGLQIRRGLNTGVIVSSFYFLLTGSMFVADAVQYGTGFYWASPAIIRLFG